MLNNFFCLLKNVLITYNKWSNKVKLKHYLQTMIAIDCAL